MNEVQMAAKFGHSSSIRDFGLTENNFMVEHAIKLEKKRVKAMDVFPK